MLLGDTVNAEKTKARFDNFNTPEMYNWVARAYHRMGNTAQSSYYAKLAAQAGYVKDANDNAFYSLTFK